MALCDGLSHCKLALVFAVLMDLLGGAALLMGVFAPLEVSGRDFGDLLVYTGMKYTVILFGRCKILIIFYAQSISIYFSKTNVLNSLGSIE